jgi:hypothetical protein
MGKGRGTMFRRLFPAIYLVIGVIVAAQHHYLAHLNSVSHIVSAALAIVLWPLLLLGVNLNIKL